MVAAAVSSGAILTIAVVIFTVTITITVTIGFVDITNRILQQPKRRRIQNLCVPLVI